MIPRRRQEEFLVEETYGHLRSKTGRLGKSLDEIVKHTFLALEGAVAMVGPKVLEISFTAIS